MAHFVTRPTEGIGKLIRMFGQGCMPTFCVSVQRLLRTLPPTKRDLRTSERRFLDSAIEPCGEFWSTYDGVGHAATIRALPIETVLPQVNVTRLGEPLVVSGIRPGIKQRLLPLGVGSLCVDRFYQVCERGLSGQSCLELAGTAPTNRRAL